VINTRKFQVKSTIGLSSRKKEKRIELGLVSVILVQYTHAKISQNLEEVWQRLLKDY